jgi:hypothetical protein
MEKKMRYVISLGIVLFFGLMIFSSCPKKAPQKIEWAVSLEDALKIASEKDKPIIAEFWMDG